MRRIAHVNLVAALLGLFAAALMAGDDDNWRPLDAREIANALTGATLEYESAWQDFRASGKTLYNAGADSWGYWRAQDDQYCSQWPPRDLWDCYDVALNEDKVRFKSAYGDVSYGTFRK